MPKYAVYQLLVAFLCAGGVFSAGQDWSYDEGQGNGPSSWHHSNPTCAGHFQTPVELGDFQLTDHLAPLNLEGYDQPLKSAVLINNGHTAHLSQSDYWATISGGCLDGPYDFAQVHFHWGRDDTRGSEHLVYGKAHPMEAHFVHIKREYGTVQEALKHPDGLAVLAVFYQVIKKNNYKLNPLIHYLQSIQPAGNSVSINSTMTLSDLMPSNTSSFLCYRNGSLTTPGCSEAVTWTLLVNTVAVGCNQMAMFRSLQFEDDTPMVDNFRPIQPLNGRIIYGYQI